jgi:hypothetical protein
MKILAIVVLSCVMLSNPIQNQPIPINQTPLSFCEVLHNLAEYNGKVIQIRGEWHGALVGDCSALKTGKYKWRNEIEVTDPGGPSVAFIGPPVSWNNSDTERNYASYRKAWTEWSELPKSRKPKMTVMATVVGRLDARLPLRLDELGNPVGFGHLNMAPARLVFSEVKDIRLEPVKRRVALPPPGF